MARIRTVKPDLFKHDELYDLELSSKLPIRLAFIGLFTCCDREGRFKWRPRALKVDVLPYDDIDFSRVLDALWTRGFLVKYESEGEFYGLIPSFAKHQVINNRESESALPEPNENNTLHASPTREPRETHAPSGEGKGKEGKGREGDMHASLTAAVPAVAELTLNDGSKYPITQKALDELIPLYPAVNVLMELGKIQGWILANPSKRKTKAGIMRFVTSWLSRAQDSSRAPAVDKFQAGKQRLIDEFCGGDSGFINGESRHVG